MIVVYDLEQFKNLHSCAAICKDSGEKFYFEISPYRDDMEEYYTWLTQVKGMIGFNNLKYDYPLLHFFIHNYKSFKDANDCVRQMYNESQRIIDTDYPQIHKPLISQCDLYAICHFDNKAKRTSLKDIQIALKWHKIQDLPYHHSRILSADEAIEVQEYNFNDTLSTLQFYKEIKSKIDLRKELSKEYNIDCLNWNDSKIGEQILIKDVCKIKEVSPKSIKSSYNGEKIDIKDCFVDYIPINQEIQDEKDRFAKLSLTNEEFKGNIQHRSVYYAFPFDFGAGGIHGCAKSQKISKQAGKKIMSSDVSSYYPNLAISFMFFIKQFGKEFVTVIKELYDKKQWAKERGLKTTLAAVKLALVSIFGKSNDEYSKLFDPTYFLKTTINGQLLLADLHLSLIKAGFQPLLLNTDGVEFIIDEDKEHEYMAICDDWMKRTGLVLDHEEYETIAIMNVNNYIGKFINGKTKHKGLFEINKDWHKDHSFKVVRLALEKYFLEGIKPEDFIPNHNNIYDFCGRIKSNAGYKIEFHKLDRDKLVVNELQKTNRYFFSTKGGYLYKFKDGKHIAEWKGQKVTLFNDFYEAENYNIDYSWYIKEVRKIINEIEPKQLSLF